MADFQEHLSPLETPLTKSLLGQAIPGYCSRTIMEPRHPEYGIWQRASELLEKLTPEDIDDWWEPSPRYRELRKIVSDLREVAFNAIPNPEYDEDKCEGWHKDHPGRRPIDQKKVVWGTSDLVSYDNNERVTIGSTGSNSTS